MIFVILTIMIIIIFIIGNLAQVWLWSIQQVSTGFQVVQSFG